MVRYFTSPDEWRSWLETHHDAEKLVWVGFHKRATGKPSLTWPQAVDEALCFGWIDGVRHRVDERRYKIRFTPRKASSKWSNINVGRVAELTRTKRMTEAGLKAFAARKQIGVYSYEQRNAAKLAPADDARLRANTKAWKFFQSQPPWYQRSAIFWVVSAKKEETRQRRLDGLIRDSARGKTIPPLTRPQPISGR